MYIGAPTHVIIDHVNGGGPSGWWPVIISGLGAAIVGGAVAASVAVGTVRAERRRTAEEHRRSLVVGLCTTLDYLIAAIRHGTTTELSYVVQAKSESDAIRREYGDRYPRLTRWLRLETERLEQAADLRTKVAEMGGDAEIGLLEMEIKRLDEWRHHPDLVEDNMPEIDQIRANS